MTWATSRPNGSIPVLGSQRPKTWARCTSLAARYCSAPPRVYSNSVRGARCGAAGRLGWRRIRAWMGLLIGAEHVVVRAEGPAVEGPGVQGQDPAGLGGEGRVAGEDPGADPPRLDRVGG